MKTPQVIYQKVNQLADGQVLEFAKFGDHVFSGPFSSTNRSSFTNFELYV
jgi:hypothetical protein